MRDKGRQRRQVWAITICKKKWTKERERERDRSSKGSLCVGAKGMEKEEGVESSFSLCSRNWLKSNGEEIQRDSWKSCFEFCGDRCAMENFSFPSSVSKTMETKGASFERETKPWSRIFLYHFLSLSLSFPFFFPLPFLLPPSFLFSSFKAIIAFYVLWLDGSSLRGFAVHVKRDDYKAEFHRWSHLSRIRA